MSDAYEGSVPTPKLGLDEDLLRSRNLAERMPEDYLKQLGRCVVEDYQKDEDSRADWKERTAKALKLALQVTERKTFPWDGAANVKFPLITIAAMQYSSRAYPALVSGPYPVAARPIGEAPNPVIPPELMQAAQQNPQAKQKLAQFQQAATKQLMTWMDTKARAERIARHMSWQILEEDETWEENHDRALLIQCILGCVFKKTYFDPLLNHNISECVNPRDLVVSYYTQNLDTAPRYTHVIYFSANECKERETRGLFLPFLEGTDCPPTPPMTATGDPSNERQGTYPTQGDRSTPYECLEQYLWLDFDGDGYAEPYVVTVRRDTSQVLRIVARFTRADIDFTDDGRVVRITPVQAFTKYPFIPSPDGGFYDLGFGQLLGPLNESIDSAINQLLDAGTLANSGGGFLGRGFRDRKGEFRFRPGEWHTLNTAGDDLRKSILPLPTPQPNSVLFQLLSILIEYGESIAGATDILQGKNPGQNTPAETSRAMVEQGMKIFNGIYKRTHRAMTQEFRKLFRLNRIYISDQMPYYIRSMAPRSRGMAKDYEDSNLLIACAADPFYMSDAQRYNQAVSLYAVAHQSPGYDLAEVNYFYLSALKVQNPERFYPNPKGPFAVPPPPNPKVQLEQMKLQQKEGEAQRKFKLDAVKLSQEAEKVSADIQLIEAQIIKLRADAQNEGTKNQINFMNAQVAAHKNHMEHLLSSIELLHSMFTPEQEPTKEGKTDEGSKQSGVSGMAGPAGNAVLSSLLGASPFGTPGGNPGGPNPSQG